MSNYQVSVDRCLIADLLSTGCRVYRPDDSFRDKMDYLYRWPDDPPGTIQISYQDFISHPRRFALLCACTQHWEAFNRFKETRGNRDELVLLSAQVELKQFIPADFVNYLITHDVEFHRLSKAKYKILYFNRPNVTVSSQKDIRKSFENKNINLYQNNFCGENKALEVELATKFREVWEKRTGYRIPFYGTNSENGMLFQKDIHQKMLESMFTLSFKKIETWGQMVNESMLLKTPVILADECITGTFRNYEITEDTSIIKRADETIEELVDRILGMTFEEYETLCIQAKAISEIFTAEQPRKEQLRWLFSKIPE